MTTEEAIELLKTQGSFGSVGSGSTAAEAWSELLAGLADLLPSLPAMPLTIVIEGPKAETAALLTDPVQTTWMANAIIGRNG